MARSEFDAIFVYAGAYTDLDDAKADFEALGELHKMDFIGKYQAAIFEKTADGKAKVVNTTSTSRSTGAKWGTAIGAVFGLFFPPGLLLGAALGAGAGALVGNLSKGWFGSDIKDIAGELDPGEAGVILVAQATPDLGVEKLLKKARKAEKKEVTGEDKAQVEEALEVEEDE